MSGGAGIAPHPRAGPVRITRWAVALIVLLLLEGALVSARVNAAPLQDRVPHWWAAVLAQLGITLPLVAAIATASMMFAGAQLRGGLSRFPVGVVELRWSWPALIGHCIGFLLFFKLTIVVFDGDLEASAMPELWVTTWLAVGMVTLALWGATLIPRRAVLPVAKLAAGALPASVAIGIAAWIAGQITDQWWEALRHATMWLVSDLAQMCVEGLVVAPDEFVIGTPGFLIKLAPKCSGYEGIGLIAVFLGAYLWVFRRSLKFPQALVLLPLGMAAAWLLNAVRLVALILIGARVSPDIALVGFTPIQVRSCFAGWRWGSRRSLAVRRSLRPLNNSTRRSPARMQRLCTSLRSWQSSRHGWQRGWSRRQASTFSTRYASSRHWPSSGIFGVRMRRCAGAGRGRPSRSASLRSPCG